MPDDTRRLRARLATAAERVIAALDALDGDVDLEDSHDAEDDPTELGISDDDGYHEQIAGEPSLGFTEEIDQRMACHPRRGFLFDGEATHRRRSRDIQDQQSVAGGPHGR